MERCMKALHISSRKLKCNRFLERHCHHNTRSDGAPWGAHCARVIRWAGRGAPSGEKPSGGVMVVVLTPEEKLRKNSFLSFSSEMKRLYHTLYVDAAYDTTHFRALLTTPSSALAT